MCNEVIEALNQLTETVGKHSFLWELILTVLAALGSAITAYASEGVKEWLFRPRGEFGRLRRKVIKHLGSYARYYLNRIDIKTHDASLVQEYSGAADRMHELSMNLEALALDSPRRRYGRVRAEHVLKASGYLRELSNSFFTPYGCPGANTNQRNRETSAKIKELLGIDQMQ